MTENEFQQEVMQLRDELLHTARRYLSNDEEAQDVVQDSLLRLWNMRESLRHPLAPLAHTVVKNAAISQLRQRRRHPTTDAQLLHEPPDEDDDTHERVERMMQIITTLPGKQQDILRMRHFEEMEMSEIAEQTGTNQVAVRQQLSRARKALRQAYLNKYKE